MPVADICIENYRHIRCVVALIRSNHACDHASKRKLSMSQDSDIYLEDILEAIDRIQEYVQNVTHEIFFEDRNPTDSS